MCADVYISTFNCDFHEIHTWNVSRVDFYVPKVLFALKTALAISSNSASLLGFNKIKVLITKYDLKSPVLWAVVRTDIFKTIPFL